jgi:hypothetical protein
MPPTYGVAEAGGGGESTIEMYRLRPDVQLMLPVPTTAEAFES